MGARKLERSEDLPWILVGGEEWVGLEHPQIVELAPAANPEGPALGRVVLFREEDYFEKGEEGWVYVGLLPLELEADESRGDEDPQEVETGSRTGGRVEEEEGENEDDGWGSLLEERFFGRQFTWPETVPCPVCPGEGVLAGDFVQPDCAGYVCADCETSLFAERREGLLNAAVLFLLEDSLAADEAERRHGE